MQYYSYKLNLSESLDIADCEPLLNPDNGEVTFASTIQDSVANYSCAVGREVQGMVSRTCLNSGSWSDIEPTCERKSSLVK